MDDKMLARIRGLLAKAERTDNEHEREVFQGKAMELIAKYGIDEALLAVDDENLRRVLARRIEVTAPFTETKIQLILQLADPLGVETVTEKRWRDGGYRRASQKDRIVKTVNCYGREGDLDRLEILYTSLLAQQLTEFARAEVPLYAEYESERGKQVWRRNWLLSYAIRIGERFEEITREVTHDAAEHAEGGATGMELVLASKRDEVKAEVAKIWPTLNRVKTKFGDGGGHSEGREAADRADLGQDRIKRHAPNKEIS